jgi:hypothetical protein
MMNSIKNGKENSLGIHTKEKKCLLVYLGLQSLSRHFVFGFFLPLLLTILLLLCGVPSFVIKLSLGTISFMFCHTYIIYFYVMQ